MAGCNSNTLGLSNLLSDMVESVCGAINDPYEVISSDDMLSRVETFNKQIEEERKKEGDDWDWRDSRMLLGSSFRACRQKRLLNVYENRLKRVLLNGKIKILTGSCYTFT